MTKAKPADSVEPRRGSLYPEPYKSRMGERTKRRLGEAFDLQQFGVNLVELQPGAQSALRHWHTREEELVYILSGELVLITNDGEQIVRAGDCAGFRSGIEDGHHMINRSNAPARYLEVGTRFEDDQAFYPEDDMMWKDDKPHRKDGTPY
jgi:uncharacterized cupin superfamily protein